MFKYFHKEQDFTEYEEYSHARSIYIINLVTGFIILGFGCGLMVISASFSVDTATILGCLLLFIGLLLVVFAEITYETRRCFLKILSENRNQFKNELNKMNVEDF